MAQAAVRKRKSMPRRAVWSGALVILGLAVVSIAPARAELVEPSPSLSPGERAAMIQVLERTCDPATPDNPRSLDDRQLQQAILRYATTELGLRLRPAAVNSLWSYTPPAREPAPELSAARARGRAADWLASLSPDDRRYRGLVQARCRYRAFVRAHGWSTLPASLRLGKGAAGPEVVRLRSRLAAEGYLPTVRNQSPAFDGEVAGAVREFQRRHGLKADGVVGAQTLAALNVSPEDRLSQIEANLERWRWLPRALAARRLEVDVAHAEATLFAGDRRILQMRAIVGDPRHRTPLFSSRIQAVVFNPVWVVPSSIAEEEIWPRIDRDPGYLRRNGFTETKYGLQQAPGPKNPLGGVKFDFPSPFGVYLHDTNAPSLFGRNVRTLSHGCIRLERPRELAASVLADQGWTLDSINGEIANGASRRVTVSAGPAIYTLYMTAAAADDGGPVEFTRDPYGWDAQLAAALAARRGPPASNRANRQRTVELVQFASRVDHRSLAGARTPQLDGVMAACAESTPG